MAVKRYNSTRERCKTCGHLQDMEAANTPKHPTDAEGKYLNSLCVNDEADREVISRGWGGGGVLSIGIHVIGKCMYA